MLASRIELSPILPLLRIINTRGKSFVQTAQQSLSLSVTSFIDQSLQHLRAMPSRHGVAFLFLRHQTSSQQPQRFIGCAGARSS